MAVNPFDELTALLEPAEGESSPDPPPVIDDTFKDPLGYTQKRERRGRPRNAPSERKVAGKTNVKTLTAQLVGVHLLISKVTGKDEIALSQDEGEMLGKAIADILEEYSIAASNKAMLWLNLVAAVAIIYIPRLLIIRANRQPKQPKQQPTAQPRPAPRSGAIGPIDWSRA